MKAAIILISTIFLFLGLLGTLGTTPLFANKETNTFSVSSEIAQERFLSIKVLDQFTAKENLRFTIRNAGGILIPTSSK
jgi:hypothetical protein